MQHILNIIDPSTEDGLISVADMKKILNIQPTDTSKDEGLGLLIDAVSIQMAVLVNRRTFGIEKVEETFYEIENSKRLYFSKWPVKFDDIQELTFQGTDILTSTDWVLEELTGTLYTPPSGIWNGTVNAIYTGGYALPEGAPLDLQRACSILVGEGYYSQQRGGTLSNVRMIAHKQARVMYYPGTDASSGSGSSVGAPQTWNSVRSVLQHYFR